MKTREAVLDSYKFAFTFAQKLDEQGATLRQNQSKKDFTLIWRSVLISFFKEYWQVRKRNEKYDVMDSRYTSSVFLWRLVEMLLQSFDH